MEADEEEEEDKKGKEKENKVPPPLPLLTFKRRDIKGGSRLSPLTHTHTKKRLYLTSYFGTC